MITSSRIKKTFGFALILSVGMVTFSASTHASTGARALVCKDLFALHATETESDALKPRGIVEVRPEKLRTLPASIRETYSKFAEALNRTFEANESGKLTESMIGEMNDRAREMLQARGMSFTERYSDEFKALVFEIRPSQGGSQFNRMASALSRPNYDLELIYSPTYNLKEGFNGAYWARHKAIFMSHLDVLEGRASGTLLHEIRHAFNDLVLSKRQGIAPLLKGHWTAPEGAPFTRLSGSYRKSFSADEVVAFGESLVRSHSAASWTAGARRVERLEGSRARLELNRLRAELASLQPELERALSELRAVREQGATGWLNRISNFLSRGTGARSVELQATVDRLESEIAASQVMVRSAEVRIETSETADEVGAPVGAPREAVMRSHRRFQSALKRIDAFGIQMAESAQRLREAARGTPSFWVPDFGSYSFVVRLSGTSSKAEVSVSHSKTPSGLTQVLVELTGAERFTVHLSLPERGSRSDSEWGQTVLESLAIHLRGLEQFSSRASAITRSIEMRSNFFIWKNDQGRSSSELSDLISLMRDEIQRALYHPARFE